MYIITSFILMFLSGFCYSSQVVLPGSDVCLRCDVSFLSESSTLQWEKGGKPTSNTTLIYNNSAYIILHTVDEYNTGEYYCRLTKDGSVQTVGNHTLNVKTYSYNRNFKTNTTIYRESSSKSDVLLICKSSSKYQKWRWTWEKSSNSQIDLITVEKGGKVVVKGPIKPGRFSSTTYNSQAFIFHISPVHFNYSGTYRCITEKGTYTTTMLHTIRVSVESPGGVSRNQSVLLTCELSEATESVTLVWLRMERNRGVLEKQKMMTEKNKLKLTVNLSSNQTEPLHWQCAVFTENQLRALAPVVISFTSETTNPPTISTNNSAVSNQRETDTLTATNQEDAEDSHLQMVIIVSCAVTASVPILLALVLVFKRLRNTVDAGPVSGSKSQDDDDNIHYALVTVAASSQGADGCHASSEVLDKNAAVIYSAIKVQ